MNISLHIDHLVLDGLALTPGQGRVVRAELEDELVRLLKTHGVKSLSATDLPTLPVAPIQLTADSQPAHWGRQIARSLYAGLTPASRPNLRPTNGLHSPTVMSSNGRTPSPAQQIHQPSK